MTPYMRMYPMANGPLIAGQEVAWTMQWQLITNGFDMGPDNSVYGPYTVVWDFGGGAQPDVVSLTEQMYSSTATVLLADNPAGKQEYTLTVTITDTRGCVYQNRLAYTVQVALTD